MSTIAIKDGTQIYYNDRGSGQPIVFGHGWPVPLRHQGLFRNRLGGRLEEDRRADLGDTRR
jgi:pimeloyl-ACP methyl ester carboxylesterase